MSKEKKISKTRRYSMEEWKEKIKQGTCQKCKWWKEGRLMPKVLDFPATVVGSCKRVPHTETKVENDWCGEFELI